MPGVSPTRTSLRPPGPRPRAQSRAVPGQAGHPSRVRALVPALLHPERRRGTPKQAGGVRAGGGGVPRARAPPAGPAPTLHSAAAHLAAPSVHRVPDNVRLPCHCPRRWAGQRCPRPAAAARGGGAVYPAGGGTKGRRLIAARPVGGTAGRAGRGVSPGARGGPPEGWPRPLTESLLPAGAREGAIGAPRAPGAGRKGGSSGGGVGAPSLQRCWWFLSGITFRCRALVASTGFLLC